MKNGLLCIFFLFLSFSMYAQRVQIKGIVNDTINNQKVERASVLLLRAKDSVLYQFTRSDKEGGFSFSKADTGKYILLITQNTYADYVDNIVVKDSVPMNLGAIAMTLKANILKEVVVRQQIAAMRMKGDTLEFAADSFKVRQGASVEDMLKTLPGIQVDKDGKITAQGEKVQKVLVDGEEFFGDDPTLATRNIQADAIDKVQVFDKKSDQATFTGIDDGEKNKTINLKLKEDKKKGYFGKLDLASNGTDRWNNSAMINNFKAKTKLSAYGIVSNTGKTGLDWSEQDKYGSGSGGTYDEESGGYYWMNGGDDDLASGSYYGEGLPKSWSGGVNFSDKWMDNKQTFNGSYRYNKLNTEGSGSTISQSLLPGDAYFINRENSYSFNSRQRNSVNGTYEWQWDSLTSTKITGSGYTGTALSRSNYSNSNTNASGIAVNNSQRVTSASGTNGNGNVNALFRKKFKKIGRSLSLNLSDVYNTTASTGFLRALVNYYDPKAGGFIRDSVTNQMKVNNNKINTFAAKAVYTEPLAKKLYLELNYGINSYTSDSKRLSFDSSAEGKYEALNTLYSNHYQFDVFTNTTGSALRYNGKKLTASAGSDVGFTNFYQKDLILDTDYTRHYINFFPKALFTYKFSDNMRIYLRYNGRTQQPSITQIQPVKDNTNPLMQYLGNSSLRQSFIHNFNMNFSKYNAFKERGIFMYGSFSTTAHAIVTNQVTDTSTGLTTLQYINANGNYNYYGGLQYNAKMKKWSMNYNAGLDVNGSKYSNEVNGANNVTTNNTPTISVGLSKNKEKKYDVWYNYSFGYNFTKSSIQSGFATNYWTQNHRLNADVQLPWKMEINTDINYNLCQKTNVFTANNDVFLWNAYIGRKVLKNDKAIIKIMANDILNQNKGFNRDVSSNTVTERNYQTIRRYFMLAFTWNFTKSAAGVAAGN